jgi:hypothetical protein
MTQPREHTLSKDCWCQPKVVSYKPKGKKGKK